MKILFLCGRFLPLIGGVETHVDKVARVLTNRGYEITVQTTTQEEIDLPYKVIRVQNRFIPIESYYDVIQAQDFYTYSDTLWNYSDKVYMTFHGWEGLSPPDPEIIKRRKEIEKKVLGSIQVGKYIEKWYGTKGINIWGGIDLNEDICFGEPKKNHFLFVGQLRQDLDLDKYIKILSKIDTYTCLDVIGDGDIDYFRSLCEKLLIRVRFHGEVSMIKDADKFMTIYNDAEYVFAGGYLSILQALLNNKKVISVYTNELKRDYIEWFPGKLISGYYEDEGEYISRRIVEGLPNEIVEGNGNWAKTQTWERIADTYEKLWGSK